MKISLTNYEQTLICAAFVYASNQGFLNNNCNKELQRIINKMTINTPIKTGGENQFYSPKNFLHE